MRRRGRYLVLLAVVGVGLLVAASFRDKGLRNFGVVKEGVLYRSGQQTPEGLEEILQKHHIKTVVSLRPIRDEESSSDTWEEGVCEKYQAKHIRIAPYDGPLKPGQSPLFPVSQSFLEVMDDPNNYPILVHCYKGRDRTGAMCAITRIEFDQWTADRALEEMQEYGFDPAKDPAARAYESFVREYQLRSKDKKKAQSKE
jgi:tyrosine-protein phosphatase SIW14